MKPIFASIVLAAMVIAAASAPGEAGHKIQLELQDRWHSMSPREALMSGGFAFVHHGNEVSVLDYSQGGTPQVVNGVFATDVWSMSRDGDRLYTCGSDGVTGYDIAVPVAPRAVSHHETVGNLIVAAGGRIAVLFRTGIHVLEAAGDQLTLAGTYEDPRNLYSYHNPRLVFDGKTAVIFGQLGQIFIDTRMPNNPEEVLYQREEGLSYRVRAYLSNGMLFRLSDQRLQIWNAGAEPTLLSDTMLNPVQHWIGTIAVTHRRLHVLDGQNLVTYSLRDMSSPVPVSQKDIPGARSLTVNGSTLVASGSFGVSVVDVASDNPVITAHYPTVGTPRGIAAYDGKVLVVENTGDPWDGHGRLRVVEFRSDAAVETRLVELDQRVRHVAQSDDKLYIEGLDPWVQLYDISDVDFPRAQGRFDGLSSQGLLNASGNTVVVGQHDVGMRIVDFSNPAQPVGAFTLDRPLGTDTSFGRSGDILCVAYSGRWGQYPFVYVYEMSNPTTPVERASFTTFDLSDFAADGAQPVNPILGMKDHALYVLHRNRDQIGVYDLSDPGQPRFARWMDERWYGRVMGITGNTMLVSGPYEMSVVDRKMYLFDITDPLAPVLLDIVTGVHATQFAFDGDRIYSLGSLGLSEWRVTRRKPVVEPDPDQSAANLTSTRLSNSPNPFNPTTTIQYELPSGADVSLVVYDVRGALVRTLVNGPQASGPQSIQWDGTDDRGRRVASGVYFYKLRTGANVQTRKMLLLK